VIDQRFGQSNLWLQVTQVYLSEKLTEHTITTSSSKYMIKPTVLPLTQVPDMNKDATSDSAQNVPGSDPFVQLLWPLEMAILHPLKNETSEAEQVNIEGDIKRESDVVRCDHHHFLQNQVIPKLSLEEMQMFISSAESGGGMLGLLTDSEDKEAHEDKDTNSTTTSPLLLLKELIMLPQPLLFRQPSMIHQLKDNVRQTKEWIERFHYLQEVQQLQAAGASAEGIPKAGDSSGSGSGSSSSSSKKGSGSSKDDSASVNVNDLCEQLINETQRETSTLRGNGIDLSEYLEQIMQVTQVFCLCRLPYHGFMVGCDHCEDWLHGPCIGLTKAQADRTDKYTCLRCNLKSSANQGFQSIASIISLWMSPEDAIKHLETKRYRVTKKVSKEEADLNLLLTELALAQKHIHNVMNGGVFPAAPTTVTTQSSETTGGDEAGASQPAAASASVSIDALNAKVIKLEEDIVTARARLTKALQEEIEIKKFYTLDMEGRLAWNQWMVMIRDMLWSNGFPSSPANCSSSGNGGVGRIPIEAQILHATHRARELGIIDFPDVVNILNSFRWVSFCYLATNLLRGPPTVKQIETLLLVTKKLKIGYMDEKMIRSITGLMNRTRGWKAKCKKLLSSSTNVSYAPNTSYNAVSNGVKVEDMIVMIDENKAKTLHEEGTLCLSVRTRLRDQLRDAIHAHTVAKEENKTKESKDSKGKPSTKDGGVPNRSRGAQKFSVKDVMNDSSGKSDNSFRQVKLVLPAIFSMKTGKVGYFSSDEDDSDHEEEDANEIAATFPFPLSDLDKEVYRYRLPAQRKLNPIPHHQLSASVTTAIAYPPVLNPPTRPPAKSYQPNYRHIGLSTSSSAKATFRTQSSGLSRPAQRKQQQASVSAATAARIATATAARTATVTATSSSVPVATSAAATGAGATPAAVATTAATSSTVVATQEVTNKTVSSSSSAPSILPPTVVTKEETQEHREISLQEHVKSVKETDKETGGMDNRNPAVATTTPGAEEVSAESFSSRSSGSGSDSSESSGSAAGSAAESGGGGDVVVTQEMLHDSLLQVAQIMAAEKEQESSDDQGQEQGQGQGQGQEQATAPEPKNLSTATCAGAAGGEVSAALSAAPFTNITAPFDTKMTLATTVEKGARPKKEKKEKKEKEKEKKEREKKKEKVLNSDKEKKSRMKKDKEPSVKGEAKKAALKAASGESKKRLRAADEKARALLESINTGTTDELFPRPETEEGELGSKFVPKTIADALKMGASFVEKKRKQGVEALKNSINASISAKKRKQGDDGSSSLSTSSSSSSFSEEETAPSLAEIAMTFITTSAALGGSGDDDVRGDSDSDEPSLKKARSHAEGGDVVEPSSEVESASSSSSSSSSTSADVDNSVATSLSATTITADSVEMELENAPAGNDGEFQTE
jgi:hypothetical protein